MIRSKSSSSSLLYTSTSSQPSLVAITLEPLLSKSNSQNCFLTKCEPLTATFTTRTTTKSNSRRSRSKSRSRIQSKSRSRIGVVKPSRSKSKMERRSSLKRRMVMEGTSSICMMTNYSSSNTMGRSRSCFILGGCDGDDEIDYSFLASSTATDATTTTATSDTTPTTTASTTSTTSSSSSSSNDEDLSSWSALLKDDSDLDPLTTTRLVTNLKSLQLLQYSSLSSLGCDCDGDENNNIKNDCNEEGVRFNNSGLSSSGLPIITSTTTNKKRRRLHLVGSKSVDGGLGGTMVRSNMNVSFGLDLLVQ